jgi:hypothetical protein
MHIQCRCIQRLSGGIFGHRVFESRAVKPPNFLRRRVISCEFRLSCAENETQSIGSNWKVNGSSNTAMMRRDLRATDCLGGFTD